MRHNDKIPVITLDGPGGTGKGTISYMLAKHLNWHFLDSGAIYRVLAYKAIKEGISLDDISTLIKCAQQLQLSFAIYDEQQPRVILDEEDVSTEIRAQACAEAASQIAANQDIRNALLQRQRDFAILPGLVTDGRDMGTVVFPHADLKIYLDASKDERAFRRYLQLKEMGNDVSLAQVVDELAKRDARDATRSHSPLKPAADAILIDTTRLTVAQVFDNVLQLAQKRVLHCQD